jgi:hypothetical protein
MTINAPPMNIDPAPVNAVRPGVDRRTAEVLARPKFALNCSATNRDNGFRKPITRTPTVTTDNPMRSKGTDSAFTRPHRETSLPTTSLSTPWNKHDSWLCARQHCGHKTILNRAPLARHSSASAWSRVGRAKVIAMKLSSDPTMRRIAAGLAVVVMVSSLGLAIVLAIALVGESDNARLWLILLGSLVLAAGSGWALRSVRRTS